MHGLTPAEAPRQHAFDQALEVALAPEVDVAADELRELDSLWASSGISIFGSVAPRRNAVLDH